MGVQQRRTLRPQEREKRAKAAVEAAVRNPGAVERGAQRMRAVIGVEQKYEMARRFGAE